MKFHPSHFVPVDAPSYPALVPLEDFEEERVPQLRHDRYLSEHEGRRFYSGRLLCNLESMTELVIGASHAKGRAPAEVKPFTLPGGEPAIPASTLRGLISSCAEAASNSALRILSALPPPSHKESRWPCFQLAPGFDQSCFPAQFFAELSLDLLPLGMRTPQSGDATPKRLTIAEQLFGFVEQRKEEAADTGRALAGRVRFSFARLFPAQADPFAVPRPVTLKILGTPNPLSASIYFKRKDRKPGRISAAQVNCQEHQPQGRVQYLHHGDLNPEDWQDRQARRPAMQVRARPLRRNLNFQFHIDFENLTAAELGLLAYSVRPTQDFYHKLGLGKPIGLGTVVIDPVACFLIDRVRRYAQDSFSLDARYHQRWIAPNPRTDGKPFTTEALAPDRYSLEREAIQANDLQRFDLPRLAADFRQKMHQLAPDVIDSFEMLGEAEVSSWDIGYTVPSSEGTWLPPLPNRDSIGKATLPRPQQDSAHAGRRRRP